MLPQIEVDNDVYSLALERMAHILDRFDHVAVSFSGGKDSTATLMVALEAAHSDPRFERHLPLRTIFYDEEAIPVETEEYVRRIGQRDDVALEWYCLPVRHRNAASRKHPYWWPWAPEARDRWVRPLPPEAITELKGFPVDDPDARLDIPAANGLLAPPELGNVALCMGIRAAESPIRRGAVRRRKGAEVNYIKKWDEGTSSGNVFKAYPVYDWSTEDVWTAPAKLGWDYNRSYDLMEMMGIGHASQRCSPAFGEEPLQKLHMFAKCFPDVWDRMVDRVPGVGAAARYANTELYGFRGKPVKPDGMPWRDFVVHYVDRFDRDAAREIRHRIATEIRNHYRQASDPIAAYHAHPDTGLSWDFLLSVAMRGDFKARRQAKVRVVAGNGEDGRPKPETWRKYADDIQRSLDAGLFDDLGHPGRRPASGMALVPDYAKDAEHDDHDEG